MEKTKVLFTCIFFFACFGGSVYYCCRLLKKYLLNESTTTVSIKEIGDFTDNVYPSISVCIRAEKGHLLLNIDKENRTKYYEAMYGNDTEENNQEEILNNRNLLNASRPSTFYIDDVNLHYEDGSISNVGLEDVKEKYFDPEDQCCTVDIATLVSGNLQEVTFAFDISKLQELSKGRGSKGRLKIFVHGSGQLLRDSKFLRRKPDYQTQLKPLSRIDTPNFVMIEIDNLKLFKSRSDGQKECKDNLAGDDGELMDALKESVGCTPPYWIHLSNGGRYPPCKTNEQLKVFKGYTEVLTEKGVCQELKKHIKKLITSLTPSCSTMEMTKKVIPMKMDNGMEENNGGKKNLGKGKEKGNEKKKGDGNEDEEMTNCMLKPRDNPVVCIGIMFLSETFEETREVRSYDAASFLAEIGGYVGLFLGFSVFSVLIKIIDAFEKIKISIARIFH